MENEESKTDWVEKWHRAEEKCYDMKCELRKHKMMIDILLEKIESLTKKLEEYD